MQRFPLTMPAALTLSSTWLILSLGFEGAITLPLSCALLLAGLLAMRLRLYAVSMLCSSLAVGTCAAGAITAELGVSAGNISTPCARVTVSPARCSGVIEQVIRRAPHRIRYVLRAEVDARYAPCTWARVIVTEQRADSSISVGRRRIVTGLLRRPRRPTLDGEFSEPDYLRSIGVSLILDRGRGHDAGPGALPLRWLADMRQMMIRRLETRLASDVSAIVIALVIGDRSRIDVESVRAYRLSGTAHIFSVSGSHVAIVTWLVMLLIGARPNAVLMIVGIGVVLTYTLLSGAEPPAVRSAIMGIGAMLGLRAERDVHPINMLMFSVLVIIGLDPMAGMSGGFFLSVTSTLAMILVVPPCRRILQMLLIRRRPSANILLDAVAVSWGATVGVTAPAAVLFGSISLMAPLANLIVVPILSGSLVLGLGLALIPLPVIEEALGWWLTVLVRCADAVATTAALDLTSGIDTIRMVWLSIVVTLGLSWPLASRTWTGFLIRCVATVLLVCVAVLAARNSKRNEKPLCIIERQAGLVVFSRTDRRTIVAFIGADAGPVDHAACRWTRQERPDAVVGLGLWGRRMKGALVAPSDTARP
ncbi:MAG: ComEC family competence protein [Candidatus Kapabacteria bacterium]|nr:ComEC family competence protein [Candidatus Kapabacteria bacterium]